MAPGDNSPRQATGTLPGLQELSAAQLQSLAGGFCCRKALWFYLPRVK